MKTTNKNSVISGILALFLFAGWVQLNAQPQVNPTANIETTETATEPPLDEEIQLRLNFRGVPLEMVLDYLSEAAGFVIILEAEIAGTVNVWSNQPLNREEAVSLLNSILFEKGYTAIRTGRNLKIVKKEDAKQRDLPVVLGNDPAQIPRSDEMVTQIIPVRYADAVQLIQDISTLIPTYATISANASSNAIVLTDTQTSVRRVAQIIRALDTSISGISSVRVFQLLYADATELAEMVVELFEVEESNDRNRRGGRAPFFGRGGDREGGNAPQESEARQAASRVVAVADERTNSLVVAAPEELMPSVEALVKEIDTNVDDIREIRVFQLKFADATEMAQLVMQLFDEATSQQQGTTGQVAGFRTPFFGRGDNRGGRGNNNDNNTSERSLNQSKVVAVADPRTDSVIVTASRELMDQIAAMVKQLDEDSSKKQNVYVYKLEHADADNLAEILRNMFENQANNNVRNRNNQNQNQNTLGNRTGVSIDTGLGMNNAAGGTNR